MRLENKVAIVTGGGSGIGEAAARRFANEGAAVGVLDYRLDAAQAVARTIEADGGRAIALEADVREESQVAAAVQSILATYGSLHVVFANAGINGMQCPIEDMTYEEWRATIDHNLTGTFLPV